MIRVLPAPEPPGFDEKVRRPGMQAIQERAVPENEVIADQGFWRKHAYWSEVRDALYEAYAGICAYRAVRVPKEMSWQLDHFLSKSRAACRLAYEWRNYRLAEGALNNRKSSKIVVDPFEIQTGDVRMNFVDGSAFANPELNAEYQAKLETTLRDLGLASGPAAMTRLQTWNRYQEHEISTRVLREDHPFIHAEALRQGLL